MNPDDLIDDALVKRNIEVTIYDLPSALSADQGQPGLGLFRAINYLTRPMRGDRV